ncbi:lanthionine synthetase C family protein [Chitinophaga sp. 30R24]|uniref:lanthionine synthetase C family protein n=1 Tax=Chitinophaga sp. 30R24 TaxID=3248838 RepID=UPI003B917AAC
MNDKKTAVQVLQQICKELDQFTSENKYAGLLGGYTGSALFYAYYYQLTSNEIYLERTYHIVQRSLQALSEEGLNGSHCSGIAGIGWTLLHLAELELIAQTDLDDAFAEVDQLLAAFMETEIREGRTDFLHQGLGVALYFLHRLPAPIAQTQLAQLVQQLASQSFPLTTGIAWKDHFSSISQEAPTHHLFNLGLAHGVPSIIAILARIYENGIARTTVSPLITQSIDWLWSTRKASSAPDNSLFPVIVDELGINAGQAQSRLGWCYGDLGIATMLWGVGERLSQAAYKAYAHDIFRHIAQHRNRRNGAVHDACLCHGSAGIAHILQQAAIHTNDVLLQQSADEWWHITLQMNTWTDGPAGYKFYSHPEYIASYNMLEGITGIGLALISFLEEEIKPAWNASMLIY